MLRIAGPGAMASAKPDSIVNEDGSIKPGYNDLFAAFYEDYPGVTIEFTPATWTDWKAFLQAEVIRGDRKHENMPVLETEQ